MAKYSPYSRRELRKHVRSWLRAYAKLVAIASVLSALLIAIESAILLGIGPTRPLQWFLLGAISAAIVGALICSLGIVFFITDASAVHQLRGAWGEDNTREELKRAKARGQIWGWVDSVTVATGDVDHLVVTRQGGLVAMDSKWRTKVDVAGRDSMVREAKASRRRAEGVVRTVVPRQRPGRRSEGTAIKVIPLVVLWGSAQTTLPPGTQMDGVHFVRGRDLLSWLAELEGDIVDQASADELLASIEEYRADAWSVQVNVKPR